MDSLYETILRTIASHRMFTGGERVAVAVSGGPDSMALLILLHRLSARFSLSLLVAHFNHQLRGTESEGDEQFVRDVSLKLGLNCVVGTENVHRLALEKHRNEEAVARECRYHFLKNLSVSEHIGRVALGHTANDQAETLLMRLIRGTGTRGLGSIHPVVDDYFVRPLLDVTRTQVERFLSSLNIAWREDSTNLDRRRSRNRIRHELLPLLSEKYNPLIVRQLARTAAQSRLDERFLSRIATAWFDQIPLTEGSGSDPEKCVTLPISELADLDAAIRTRVIRLAIERTKGNLKRIDGEHVESIQRLVDAGQSGDSVNLPLGLHVERVFEKLRFSCGQPEQCPDYEVVLPVPGSVEIPYGGLRWASRLIERGAGSNEGLEPSALESGDSPGKDRHPARVASFDYGEISLCLNLDRSGKLKVRNVRPGDRYQPLGSERPVKVHELLCARRIAASERRRWPLLMAGDEILWARGFAESQKVAVTGRSRQILMIAEEPESGE